MAVQTGLVAGHVVIGIADQRPRRLLKRLQAAALAGTRQNLARNRHTDRLYLSASKGYLSHGTSLMTPAARQIVFINTAHTITHYSLLILPTAGLAMAVPGGAFGAAYGPIPALATGMFVLYGLLSLPQGWLVQRFGRKA